MGRTARTSHSLIVLSSEPDTRVSESGDQSMSETPAMCASKVCSYLPVLACQTLMVLSAAFRGISNHHFTSPSSSYQGGGGTGGRNVQQLASHFPSGLNLTAETPSLWPLSVY